MVRWPVQTALRYIAKNRLQENKLPKHQVKWFSREIHACGIGAWPKVAVETTDFGRLCQETRNRFFYRELFRQISFDTYWLTNTSITFKEEGKEKVQSDWVLKPILVIIC